MRAKKRADLGLNSKAEQLEEPHNATHVASNQFAVSHRMPEFGRFIVVTSVHALNVNFSDRP